MDAPANRRAPTELEGAALGLVVRDGPCTSYAVAEIFRGSPSEVWSGSAGSIYPLMRRLERRGLVVSESGATGRRGRRVYRATPEGRREFRRWLTDAGRAAGMGHDPLRTRLVFLDLLPRGSRAGFFAAVREALARVPPPPRSDERIERLHRRWNRARRRIFDELVAALEGDG
jgi:DNA-binding PadR family transcriptional regulator